ncbi:MAG: AAA family ATPase [Microthrixaceae bacterium]
MEVSILGPLKLWGDEGAIDVGGPLRRVLVTRLVVAAGRVVPAERLIEDVWGDDPPASASTLQSHISHLRRALGADRLGSESGGYCLFLAGDEVDATVFEEEVREARRLLDIDDAASAAAVLGTALARWRGPALADARGAAWAEAESARLDELRLVATESFLDARLALGHHRDVVAEAEAAVAEHPLRERLWAQLVLALYRCGRQAEALRAYQRLRATLGDELGIEPSSELRDLERLVLDQDASLDLDVVASAAAGRTLPTGVVTFLLTDVVGSTRLWETAAPKMGPALARHDAIVRDAVEAHGGVLLKARGEGDSTFSVFGRATDGVAAARAVARSLAGEPWPLEAAISVRVAVHTGEAEERDGDYYGRAVNRVARLRAIAGAGEILLTRATADLVVDHLPANVHLVERGAQELRDLDRAEVVYELRSDPAGRTQDGAAGDRSAMPLPARLTASSQFGFVGRTSERDVLVRSAAEAATVGRRVVLVAGEPGIGKTTLAAEVARGLHADGVTVLYGHCDAALGVPYLPWAQALGHLLTHAPDAVLDAVGPARLGDLSRLVPEVGQRRPGSEPTSPGDFESDRYRLFAAVVAALDAAGPVVLVLDDLHAADSGTLGLFRYVVSATAGRLLVVGTYRDSDVDAEHPLADLLADLRREDGVDRMVLRGLDGTDVVALVESSSGQALAGEQLAFVHAIRQETDGNPFFTIELLQHLVETGAVALDEAGRWMVDAEPSSVGLPDSVREVVGRRVAHLGEAVRRVLEMAAVIGPTFGLDVLVAAAVVDEEETLALLERAEAAGLVVSVAPGEFRFAHALVPAILEGEISPTRRARAHAVVAEAIESLGMAETRVQELARHWAAAARPIDVARAVDYAVAAGRQALSSLAPDEAVVWYTQALDLLAEQPEPDERRRCELLGRLGAAQRKAGVQAYRETLLDAARLAERLGDTEQLVRSALGNNRGIFSVTGHVDDDRVAVLEAALDAVGAADTTVRARLLATLAAELAFEVDDTRRRALSDEAVAIARRMGDQAALMHVLLLRFSTIWSAECIDERRAIVSEAERLAAATSNAVVGAWAVGLGHTVAIETGDLAEIDRTLEVYAAAVEQLGMPFLSCLVLAYRSARALLAGDIGTARSVADEARRAGEVLGPEDYGITIGPLVHVRRYEGRLAEVMAEPPSNMDTEMADVEAQMARAWCDLGRTEDAGRLLDAAVADGLIARRGDFLWLARTVIWSEVACATGRDEHAAMLYDELLPFRYRVAAGGPHIWSLVEHTLGELAVVLGRHDAAVEHFAAAVAFADRLASPFLRCRAEQRWGALLLTRRGPGDVEHGTDLVHQALATSQSIGCGWVERDAAAVLASSATEPDPPPLPARLTAASAAPVFGFAGRTAALDHLHAAFERAAAEAQPHVVLVGGEPGVGKTTLMARFADVARGSGATVLLGECREGAAAPYQPWITALTHLVHHTTPDVLADLSPVHAAALRKLLPSLAERLPPGEAVAGDHDTERFLLQEAVVALLGQTSARSPLVLILDDLQWADAATLALLGHVIGASIPLAVVVVAAYRQTDLTRGHPATAVVADLHREPTASRVELAGLDATDVVELVEAASGHNVNPEGTTLAEALRRETDGNAFFLTELLRYLGETGETGDIAHGTGDQTGLVPDLERMSLPASVRDVVTRRVERLGDEAARVLSLACVLGREVDVEILATVADADPEAVIDILDDAVRAALIVEVPDAPGRYRFAHAIVQHTLYQDLSATRRQRTHERVARAMETAGAEHAGDVMALAEHWLAAGRPAGGGKALHYAQLAGDTALAALAPADAASWYTRALDLLDRHPEPDELTRGELILHLAEAQRQAGHPDHRQTTREAGRLALRLGNEELLVAVALSREPGMEYSSEVDPDRLAVLAAALDAAGTGDSTDRSRLLACLAEETDQRDVARRCELAEEAIAVARRIGDEPTLLAVLNMVNNVRYTPANLDVRLADSALMLDLAERTGDLSAHSTALCERALACMEAGDLEAFDACVAEVGAIAARTGLPWNREQVLMRQAWRHVLAGEHTEALACNEEFLRIGSVWGNRPTLLSAYASILMRIRLEQGELDQIVDVLRQAADENPMTTAWSRALMVVHLELGHIEEAAGLFATDEATGFDAPLDIVWLSSMAYLADCACDLHRPEAGAILYERLAPYGDRFVFTHSSDKGAVARSLGRLATLLGRYDEAAAHLAAALAMHERMRAPYWTARTSLDLAALYLARQGAGDVEAARAALASVTEAIDTYGYSGLGWRLSELERVANERPLPAGLAVESPFPFAGRSEELAALDAAWKDAGTGRRHIVLLAGELGMGKTRLAAEAARAAHHNGALVLFGRCDEDVVLPYQPFVEALRAYVADAPRDVLDAHIAEHGGALARLVPELTRRVPDAPPPASSSDPETERHQLFEAVVGLLALAGRDATILLVLDDLHWASRPTALLLRHLARAATAMPLLVVGTYRHTDLGDGHPLTDVLADLRQEPAVQRLHLRGLSDADAVAFAETAAGHHLDEANVALAHAVHRETDGNPFFMGELYLHAAESGIVRSVDGRWTVADDVDHVSLPESIREVVGRRVRRLPQATRDVLGVAAVIGATFDLPVLMEATGTAADELLDAVEAAMQAVLVTEVAEAPGRYRFAHGVLRSTLYEDLSAARRLHLHARVAAAVETVHGTDRAAADLAHHWYRATPATGGAAGTATKAFEALTRAGRRAMASAAFEEAVGHQRRALEVLDVGLVAPDDVRRVDALIDLGTAEFAAGEPAHRETVLTAARLARAAGDAGRLAQSALALSPGLWSSAPAGEVDPELIELLEAAIEFVPADGPQRPRLLAALAMEINYGGDLIRQRALLDEALDGARHLGDSSTLLFVLARRLSTAPANVDQRLAESAELLGLTAELGDPVLAYVGVYARMNATWAIGDVTETDRLIADGVQLAEQSGRPFLRWSSLYAWTARLIATGRLDEAEAVADEYLRIGTSIGQGTTAWAAWSYAVLRIRLRQGRGMDEVVDRQLEGAATGPPILGWRTQVPLVLCEVDRDDEARAHLETDAALNFAYLDDNPLAQHLLPGLASACAHLGATDVAPLLYERLLPFAGELGNALGAPNSEAPTAHHLGALAALLGRHEEADERFALALEFEARTGDRYCEAQTRLAWSRSLAARGDVDKARALAEEAARIAEAQGFATLARRAASVYTELDRGTDG